MIRYQTTASFSFSTNIRPELGLEKETRGVIKYLIEKEGIDSFLDKLEYGDVEQIEVSEEEMEATEDGDLLIPMGNIREMLTAISLGILEVEGMTKEEAEEALKRFPEETDRQ
jgi:hypothetical protein